MKPWLCFVARVESATARATPAGARDDSCTKRVARSAAADRALAVAAMKGLILVGGLGTQLRP